MLWRWWPALCCLAPLLLLVNGNSESLDYDHPDVKPAFTSKPTSFNVKEGDAITMPCNIKDQGPYPVIWQQGKKTISAGPTITVLDRRYQLRGNTLQLERVRAKDAGTYSCSVNTDPAIMLTHTVDVLYGPQVVTEPESGVLVTEKGQEVMLKCFGEGKPPPRLRWKRQDGNLPGGEQSYAGPTYHIQQVSRQMAGLYQCVADNGVGPVAVANVDVQVHYAPEVEVEKSTLYVGEGRSVKLICYVYSDPPAQVIWTREGSVLDPSRHVRSDEDHAGPGHVLTIRSLRQDDFDTYTCQARNNLGTAKGRMVLTGVADRVKVTSAPIGGAPDNYDLAWRVESYSNVIEYKVAYRRAKYNTSVEKPSSWKEVVVPNPGRRGRDEKEEVEQSQRITLRDLRPATLYDLYIQARNKHGWNAVSDIFHFSTISRGAALESRVADNAAVSRQPVQRLLTAAPILTLLISNFF